MSDIFSTVQSPITWIEQEKSDAQGGLRRHSPCIYPSLWDWEPILLEQEAIALSNQRFQLYLACPAEMVHLHLDLKCKFLLKLLESPKEFTLTSRLKRVTSSKLGQERPTNYPTIF